MCPQLLEDDFNSHVSTPCGTLNSSIKKGNAGLMLSIELRSSGQLGVVTDLGKE